MPASPEAAAPASPDATTTPAAEEARPGNGKKTSYTGKATENPNAKIVAGQMRSDREEIPEGFTKADADKAETMEAALAKKTASRGVSLLVAPGCQVYWPAPYEVCGAIKDKYNSLGGPTSFLLLPTTNELTNPDGHGKRSQFQNGPIYWSAATGAHPVVNHFHQKWGQFGYEGGWLGYPKTDEIVLNGGRLQDFQGATVYWSPLTGAHPVGGAIRDKWAQTGWEGGFLGYPVSDELWVGPGGQGRMNRFERGVIYWSPTTGAWPVSGTILDKWSAAGYEASSFGFPKSDQTSTTNNVTVQQIFQGGTIIAAGPKTVNLAAYMPYITANELLADALEAADAAGKSVQEAIEGSLSEVADSNSNGPRDPANAVPIPTARRAGDLFYSDAATGIKSAQYEHGHNGIYVTTANTVQSLDPERGVQLVLGSDPNRKVHNPQLMEVNAASNIRAAAATYASGKVGSDYNNNFGFNRRDWMTGEAGTYNCSQLVWAAYMNASNARIDLDVDGGWGVWPKDIRDSQWVTHY